MSTDQQKPGKNIPQMTAETIGRDLLQALVQEVRLLPDVWPKLSENKQNDVIDRLRKRVITNVQQAVHLLASDGRVTVVAELEQVTVKDGIKAVLTMSKSDPNRHDLIDCQGKTVLIALADAEAHMGEVAAVRGEPDQRAMNLGKEYDPKGDGNGMDGEAGDSSDQVVDVELKEAPALPNVPTQAQLDDAYQGGEQAFREGKSINDAPKLRHELVASWTQGWRDAEAKLKKENADAAQAPYKPTDELFDEAKRIVIRHRRASISYLQRQLHVGYNRAAHLIEELEKAGVISTPDAEDVRRVLVSDDEAQTA